MPDPKYIDFAAVKAAVNITQVLDHVIVGYPGHCSLREMGFFW